MDRNVWYSYGNDFDARSLNPVSGVQTVCVFWKRYGNDRDQVAMWREQVPPGAKQPIGKYSGLAEIACTGWLWDGWNIRRGDR